jgi:hypothetical protein
MIPARDSGTAPPGQEATTDGDMTAERDEVKYLVAPAQVPAFVTAMGRKLPHHRFTGAGASKLPRPQHFVTTIYFDTPSRHQYRAARADGEHNLKMRAKEYYDLHPSLAELATDPRQIVEYQPVLWLELKFRDGSKSGKRRIGVPKHQVPAFFAEGLVTAEMIELQRPQYGAEGEAVLRQISEYCSRYGEPFRADCLVSYRRLPWQDAEGQVRITLDLGLEFYAPPPDLWQRDHALLRETLGKACGREPNAVLEVKTRGALPGWLAELLQTSGARRLAFSKFEEAARAVHGGGDG